MGPAMLSKSFVRPRSQVEVSAEVTASGAGYAALWQGHGERAQLLALVVSVVSWDPLLLHSR